VAVVSAENPAELVRRELAALADPQRAAGAATYFQTGPGGYGEGDRFLGVRVPQQRAVARRFRGRFDLDAIGDLLDSRWHEERSTALFLLVAAVERADCATRAEAARRYLGWTSRVDNWDLVDASAPAVLGGWLLHCADEATEVEVLDRLAASASLWERRIAMLATFAFVKAGRPDPALRVAEALLDDRHDLIHKAVGWMLREVGNRDRVAEEEFLLRHHRTMPRTALRYAIERFEPEQRREYLAGISRCSAGDDQYCPMTSITRTMPGEPEPP
jgi:3-methyladenine DNA glycosylase AlkD